MRVTTTVVSEYIRLFSSTEVASACRDPARESKRPAATARPADVSSIGRFGFALVVFGLFFWCWRYEMARAVYDDGFFVRWMVQNCNVFKEF